MQAQGAEAVREAALAVKLHQMEQQNATKEQIQAEKDLFEAQRANANAADLAKINERIEATQRLTAAILGGAEAERQAANENKYAEIRRGSDIPVPGMPGLGQKELGERSADAAEHERQITAEAMKPGLEYQNRVETLDQEIAALEKIRETQGDTLALEISLRDLENQRLKAMVDQSLALRTARDGVRAFFLEMQEEAKSAAQIVYDALNSSLIAFPRIWRSCSRARRQTGPRCSSRPARKWCSPASRASWRRGSGSWASWPASTLDTVSRMEPPEIRFGSDCLEALCTLLVFRDSLVRPELREKNRPELELSSGGFWVVVFLRSLRIDMGRQAASSSARSIARSRGHRALNLRPVRWRGRSPHRALEFWGISSRLRSARNRQAFQGFGRLFSKRGHLGTHGFFVWPGGRECTDGRFDR